ncbi:MAG: PRC-barrel domain-containing protein [Clostridia bacterium]|nr:PRC-barrel domain-containing protein [Clostridia bacterium]
MVSNLISKRVISISEGNEIGYILDVCVDEKLTKILGFLVCDNETEIINYLEYKDIFSQNEEYVFIKDSRVLQFGEAIETLNPMNKKLFDVDGLFLGKIIEIEEKNGKISKILTKNGEFLTKNIISIGKDCVFYSSKKSFKAKFNRKEKGIVFEEKKLENAPPVVIADKNQTPIRITQHPKMILGRRSSVTILGLNNEIVIKEGELITEKKIDQAKKHNKLNQLIFNSK